MEVTVLIDNEPSRINPHLRTERGHSLHVRWGGRSLLLDTGMSARFAENARELGIEIAEVDTVVLSHGHVDHSGGLKHFLDVNRRAPCLPRAVCASISGYRSSASRRK